MNRICQIVILCIYLCLTQSCEKQGIEPAKPDIPVLYKVSMPDTLWLEKDTEFRITAVLSNRLITAGEGSAVEVRLKDDEEKASGVYTLYDDGVSGDLIAKDGMFSRKFSSRGFVDSQGLYRAFFHLQGEDVNKDIVIIKTFRCMEGAGSSAPELSNLRIPDQISLDNSAAMHLLTLDVKDPDGMEDIDKVVGFVYFPNSQVPNLQINLRHMDQAVDTTFAPETYIYLFRSEDIARRGPGEYFILFYAVDRHGYRSAEVVGALHFVTSVQNQPPVLSNLNAPDSLIAKGDTLQLSIKAVDPNGQDDIVRVWFNSYLPNGDPAKGNPFVMFDDGGELEPENIRSGDLVKGDGIYSLIIQGPAPGQKGEFRFVFQAVDRSNALSNIVEHVIHVSSE